jgi:hypothetical protein
VASVCGCFKFLLFSFVNSEYWSCVSICQRDLKFSSIRGVELFCCVLFGLVLVWFVCCNKLPFEEQQVRGGEWK